LIFVRFRAENALHHVAIEVGIIARRRLDALECLHVSAPTEGSHPMRTIAAIFENGVFRPKTPIDLPPGSEISLIMPDMQDDPVAILKARFPDSFGGMSAQDAKEMTQAIEEECERIDPDAWK
jgi:predicted DNA-binding antitoxin AbrB/MazE fold protein